MQSLQTGTIKTWNDERGFGFIAPDHGSADVFVHIHAWPTPTLPEVGERVQYQLTQTRDGKVRATQVRRLKGTANHQAQDARNAQMTDRVAASKSAQQARQDHGTSQRQTQAPRTTAKTPSPLAPRSRSKASGTRGGQSHPWHWVAVLLGGGLLAFASVRGQMGAWLPVVYGVMSLLTFVVYAHDKNAAQQDAWRVSEKHLLLLGLLGGWPGALLAQQKLRHKSSKTAFLIPFWITVLLNLAALAWWGQRASA